MCELGTWSGWIQTITRTVAQGVALTNVTVLARHAVSAARGSACPPAGSVTDDDRRQPAKQYWPIRRASNNALHLVFAYLIGDYWFV